MLVERVDSCGKHATGSIVLNVALQVCLELGFGFCCLLLQFGNHSLGVFKCARGVRIRVNLQRDKLIVGLNNACLQPREK